ncbi:hypothetical protein BOTBODRAFT_447909 [Botryobasidium botryosum FD-172 SS1]|uniref:Uncharacterized protein n=1 Tax=Botryobasidium botryosum (strain FD-172 SS1) TaxID=930990 RepID=A0A067M8G4_BOTB1|nr:hypothetical protein BOTBODRAFT_447909 [Botryobasidium botryosum FD-172 SS1]
MALPRPSPRKSASQQTYQCAGAPVPCQENSSKACRPTDCQPSHCPGCTGDRRCTLPLGGAKR